MAWSIKESTTTGTRTAAARCKPKTCPRCGGQECIERPRFFCGQLLTDKDLDAAQHYVMAKNRLHNRYLVGKGVVCGLAVRCAPCDSESVVVEPGYAIDCCGNDIVVCDPEPFNVKEYIERCFGQDKPDCDGPIRRPPSPCGEGPQEYCLFLSYKEETARPVTALVRDKGCQASRCEPSRVLETFRLDLVKQGDLPKGWPPSFWSRLRECLPRATKQMGRAAAQYYALDFQDASLRASGERELLLSSRRSVAELYRNGPNVRCQIEDLCEEPPACPTVKVNCPEFLTPGQPTTFTAVITGGDPNVTPTYNWTVSPTQQFSGQGTASITVAAHPALLETTATVVVGGYPPECRDQMTASCTSKAQHTLTTRPNEAGAQPVSLEQRGNTEVLAQALSPYFQYLIDCFCDALLVPCTPCEEPEGVLIACVTVEDGKVVKICNVARTQLITGPSLRYWFGPLFTGKHWLLEWLCCRFDLRKYKRFTPALHRGGSRLFASARKRMLSFSSGTMFSYSSALARVGKIFASMARATADVARAKIGDLGEVQTVAASQSAFGAEFYRLDAAEAKARLSKLNVNVVEERVAATPEEAHTFTNLRSLANVVAPGASVEIVKDKDNRVVAVRTRPAGGEVKQ
jgi:hypothetical protein